MPRSNRPRRTGSASSKWTRGADAPELDLEKARAGVARREHAPDGEWIVRTMTARNAEKNYVCPGCSMAILPGTAHLVVWSGSHVMGDAAGLAERRHWHNKCWTGRSYRYR